MESSSVRGALLLLLLLSASAQDADTDNEVELDTRAIRDFYPKDPNLTSEKQLLGALHEVLEKLQTKRIPPWEKKFGQVPMVKKTFSQNVIKTYSAKLNVLFSVVMFLYFN
uniref:Cocaine- and amphetamine-regulated transcript 2 n=2 Tax=Astyanax mexicanus TaxID=7994 RepID=A0A8B9H1X5_ASTMX